MLKITYLLEIHSAIRISTGVGEAGYLDNTIVRDRYGQAYIPGSSIKGKTRAATFRLAQAIGVNLLHAAQDDPQGCIGHQPCLVCRVFGSPHHQGGVLFGNAVLVAEIQTALADLDGESPRKGERPRAALHLGRQERSNTSLDRKRRVVLPERLFTFEAVDQPALFRGEIFGNESFSLSRSEIALLAVSLENITHMGGGRGRGFGRCRFQLENLQDQQGDFLNRQAWRSSLERLGR